MCVHNICMTYGAAVECEGISTRAYRAILIGILNAFSTQAVNRVTAWYLGFDHYVKRLPRRGCQRGRMLTGEVMIYDSVPIGT